MEEIYFTKEEVKDVAAFLETGAGQKVLASLDKRAQAKNNLLHVVNLASSKADFPEIGRRCALHAIETQVYLEVVEFLKNIGDYNAR